MRFAKSAPGAASRARRGRRPSRRRPAPGTDGTTGLDQWIRECSSACTFLGLTLGVFVSRKFLILPLAVAAIAVQDTVRAALKDVRHRFAG